jgi:hypothetical protein
VIDLYDVMFRTFSRGLSSYVTTQKKLNADTVKNYLKMLKIATFFEQSGKRTLVSASSKRRGDEINFKFFKMLLGRSEEFASFVTLVYKKEIDDHLDVMEFQFIAILNQLINEAKERREKAAEDQKGDESPNKAALLEQERIEAQKPLLPKKSSKIEQRPRAESDVIFLEEDDDDEALAAVMQKRPAKVDEKTKKYLALVRQFQYEDEYDDTHDLGDGRRMKRGGGRGGQGGRDNRRVERSVSGSEPEVDEVEKGSGFPVEFENEDSGEEFDLMNKWEKIQSNRQEDREDEDDEEGHPRRGGFRGGRGSRGGDRGGRGGQKIDGKRQKHNESKYGGPRRNDDYPQSNTGNYQQRRNDDYRQGGQDQRDDYRQGGQDQRDGYRPRDDDRDNYRPRGDDYRPSNKERSDRGGQQGRPKQGNRDTR